MIKVIARAVVRPQATITSYYAVLRKAGMISTKGRGRSAQDLSSLDVARAIIVMLSADSLQQGEAITRLVGDLVYELFDRGCNLLGTFRLEDAVADVIAAKAARHHGRKTHPHLLLGDLANSDIELSITATHLSATIRVDGQDFEFIDLFQPCPAITYPDDWDELSMKDALINRSIMEGMAVTRTVNNYIIEQIAEAMP